MLHKKGQVEQETEKQRERNKQTKREENMVYRYIHPNVKKCSPYKQEYKIIINAKNKDIIFYPVSSSTSLIVFVASVPEVDGATGPPSPPPELLFPCDADGGEDAFPLGLLPPCSPTLGVLLSGSSSFMHAFSSMFVHFPLVPAWLCFRCWRKWSAR